MISESTIQKIKDIALIADFANGTAKGYGQNKLYCACPACNAYEPKKRNGLQIDTVKNIAKCFKCDVFYSGAIDFVMKTRGVDYPEALRLIAQHYTILIDESEVKTAVKKTKKKAVTPTIEAIVETVETVTVDAKQTKKQHLAEIKEAKREPKQQKPFCDRQLAESGLTYDDIRIETTDDDNTARFISPFIQGTRDQYGKIVEHRGDDVLIKYLDLDGRPVQYVPEKSNVSRDLTRVRWQNPEAHKDREGNPMKYQSPAGSGSHVYIPEALRRMYKHSRKISRLFIQEGEKKAEKSCKHGLMSLGIMGINNLATNGRLPDEIQLIAQRCEVDEIIFVLDSDWNNLSTTLTNGANIDSRPRQFFAAVKSFKEYIRTLANLGLSIEIYFGNIKENTAGAKGIDDVLCTLLLNNEDKLATDVEFAINEKSGSGQYIQLNKITMLPDDKIADFWYLNDAEKFAQIHKELIKGLKEFKIRGQLRRFDETGKLIFAQQLFSDEQFWEEIQKTAKDGEKSQTLQFDYVKAMTFLQRRGFFRLKMRSEERVIIHQENKAIRVIDHTEVKDFVKEYCREIKRLDVLNMLMRGGTQFLGPEKLSNLDIIKPRFEQATIDKQMMFFRDKIWEITADGIKEINYGQFSDFVWNDKIINKKVELLPSLLDITTMDDQLRERLRGSDFELVDNGEFFIEFTEQAEQCHYLQFLINTSNQSWRKKQNEVTVQDLFENSRHLVNKITAIGYLLHDYKDDNESKAIVGMDAKLSEVGSSNGRSGKSLIGVGIAQCIPQVIVDGKDKNIDDEKFRYTEVTEKIKNVFFDDVRANFDFESLFQVITGRMIVNQKGGARFTLSRAETPKMYVTTNHALNGDGASFRDRQAFIVCSDYYNDHHKPVDDFGVAFFSDYWDANQWNLFYNLMALCLVFYFRSKQHGWSGTKRLGIVNAPSEAVELRRLRQNMGENFLTWCDMYFHWDAKMQTGSINSRLVRVELRAAFIHENPDEAKYTKPHRFKDKLISYCKYKGLDFNPTQKNDQGVYYNDFKRINPGVTFIGTEDKSGGVEYFTIANDDFNTSKF